MIGSRSAPRMLQNCLLSSRHVAAHQQAGQLNSSATRNFTPVSSLAIAVAVSPEANAQLHHSHLAQTKSIATGSTILAFHDADCCRFTGRYGKDQSETTRIPETLSYVRLQRIEIAQVQANPPYYEIIPHCSRVHPELQDFKDIVKERPEMPFNGGLGPGRKEAISTVFMRDHCQCSECIHPETKQRQLDTFSIPEDIKISHIDVEGETLKITFSDGHRSVYSQHWLDHYMNAFQQAETLRAYSTPVFWDDRNIQQQPPEVDYEYIMESSEGLGEWTRQIKDFGFCFVNGCPETPEATEKLLNRIGPIRNTHYGAFWDFTSDLSKKDLAYTSLGLPPHTDTNYFSEPARLQLFHLLSHTEGSGGESQLVDGFRVAQELLRNNEEHYKALQKMHISWHASGNEGVSLQPNSFQTVFGHTDTTKRLEKVRWNNEDRARLQPKRPEHLREWYEGARSVESFLKKMSFDRALADEIDSSRAFDKLIKTNNKAWYYEFKLQPGRPLIFDNWRVLHGRSAFTGKRRMCGGYISNDDFVSTYKMTNWGPQAVLDSIY